MKYFARAVRLSLRRRLTLMGVAATSLVVALLWGANIGAVYPVIEVVFQKKSLRNEVRGGIEGVEQGLSDHESAVARQTIEILAAPRPGWFGQVDLVIQRSRLAVHRGLVGQLRAIEPKLLSALPHRPFHALLLIVGLLFAGTVIKCVFLAWNIFLVARVTELTTLDLRNQFFRRTLQMELSSFDERSTGALMSRFTNDVGVITAGVAVLLGKTLREPLKMTVCIIGAAMISWQLLVFSLLIAPVCLLVMYSLAKSIKRANRRALEEMAQIYNRLSESFSGIKVVKAYTMERMERSRFSKTAKELYHKKMRITYYGSLTRANNEMLGVGVICLSLLAGGYLVLSEQTTLFGVPMASRPFSLGSIMLFYGFLIGTSDPVRKLADVFNQLQSAAAAADRVYPLLDREPKITDPAQPKELPTEPSELVFDDVHFHYRADEPVLRGVNLVVPHGQSVAIVGPNGCGKSTLLNLVLRFYDPQSGSVCWGDVSVDDARVRDLRRRIGLVTQQTWLFDDTIEANIRYGSPHASKEAVVAAAERAHADRFINGLEDGYKTNVGEGGKRLSGGQRQRLALARAFLRDPDILILDEATSQVDQESEHLIQQAIDEFSANRTVLFITHRMRTVVDADMIVVMDEGLVVATGKHNELLAKCDVYQRLHQTELRKSA
ncbi:MAG: ABC transporter ATP-binding protein [Pirellulaceae bacterium]|jgi:ATP-binding cassette subfamily B protein/subfamily B ATP-binding cassette protein MsbA|nr:ABC transporter ATP-binding protein [Pirellulaceae bacterium]MDP7019434.1 ABC transporter ATP-binding protein [Pirellulaceae bacterium]